jgi:cation:H+ antiporter
MTAGGAAAVAGATRVADALGRSDEAVGLVVLGLATTAELFALVLAAARRGVEEVAVAAVVGSAAYNATATLGAAATTAPLAVEGLLGPAVAAAVLPLGVVLLGRRGRLGRTAGAGLVAVYAAFVLAVLG